MCLLRFSAAFFCLVPFCAFLWLYFSCEACGFIDCSSDDVKVLAIHSDLITDDPLTLTMDADTTVTPVFSQLYTIRITNDAPAYGTVTCNGTTLNGTTPAMTIKAAEGETITFQASPVAGMRAPLPPPAARTPTPWAIKAPRSS